MRIFFDMDGTLFEWKPIILKANEDFNQVLESTLRQPGYFKNLKPQKEIVALFQRLMEEGYDAYSLSCYRPDYFSEKEGIVSCSTPLKDKKDLLALEIPQLPAEKQLFVPDGINKATYLKQEYGITITKEDFLIDDYHKNLKDWEIAGGTSIKCLNGINSENSAYHCIDKNQKIGTLTDYLHTVTNQNRKLINSSYKDIYHER